MHWQNTCHGQTDGASQLFIKLSTKQDRSIDFSPGSTVRSIERASRSLGSQDSVVRHYHVLNENLSKSGEASLIKE